MCELLNRIFCREVVRGSLPPLMVRPANAPAPSRAISLKEHEKMPLHTLTLLMNAGKSVDSYTRYGGVALENLVKAVMLD